MPLQLLQSYGVIPEPSGTGYHVQSTMSLNSFLANTWSIIPENCWHSGHQLAPNHISFTLPSSLVAIFCAFIAIIKPNINIIDLYTFIYIYINIFIVSILDI